MILLIRLAPFFLSAVSIGGFEMVIRDPHRLYPVAITLGVLTLATVVLIIRPLRRDTWIFFVAPLLLVVGALAFLLFPEGDRESLIRQVVIFGSALLLFIYFEQLFAFQYRTESYQAFALENISSYVNLTSVFMITAALVGLRYYLGITVWLVIGAGALVLFLASLHTLAMGKLEGRTRLLAVGLVTILGTELLTALLFLPGDHYVNGLLVAAFFYVSVNLIHYQFRSTLDPSRLRRYVLIGLLVVVLTMLTASWR